MCHILCSQCRSHWTTQRWLRCQVIIGLEAEWVFEFWLRWSLFWLCSKDITDIRGKSMVAIGIHWVSCSTLNHLTGCLMTTTKTSNVDENIWSWRRQDDIIWHCYTDLMTIVVNFPMMSMILAAIWFQWSMAALLSACHEWSLAIIIWLVVWNINFIFPYIGFLIIPIDFHIFQRGGPTTNQSYMLYWCQWQQFEVSDIHVASQTTAVPGRPGRDS